jgi:hypothetical protein
VADFTTSSAHTTEGQDAEMYDPDSSYDLHVWMVHTPIGETFSVRIPKNSSVAGLLGEISFQLSIARHHNVLVIWNVSVPVSDIPTALQGLQKANDIPGAVLRTKHTSLYRHVYFLSNQDICTLLSNNLSVRPHLCRDRW